MTFYSLMPLSHSLGVEVLGVDLAGPVDAEIRAALSEALAAHLVLVFRNQALTPEQYLQAATIFGPPMRQHYSQHLMPDHPDIGLVWHRNGQRAAEMWHTDHTNRECPPAATMLYGVEIPSAGGATSVANMRAAFADLPDEERQRLIGLRTVNSLDRERTDTRPEDLEKYGTPVVHPMVRTHPVHETPAVFFHIDKVTHIEGMTPEASQAYMRDLLDRMIRPEIVYTHAWRKGDVLVIDDRATMHRAHDDYDHRESRVLWRIIVEGDRPRLLSFH
ncbi:MAG TPA: TauD/TfdA family dioxygenase [Stellaceae bacterium]|nr:TauD/TfdA family dioxygenase [Stellaceae bacterium]